MRYAVYIHGNRISRQLDVTKFSEPYTNTPISLYIPLFRSLPLSPPLSTHLPLPPSPYLNQ